MNKITNQERDLVFALSDGNAQTLQLIGHMRLICLDTKDLPYLDILKWFLKQGLTHYKLPEYVKEKCDGSILQALANARKGIHNDFKARRIYVNPQNTTLN